MELFTIGFTKKSAEKFFGLLQENEIERIVDIRLKPNGQLAGFTRQKDLKFFLDKLIDCEYHHFKDLAPTKEILSEYRNEGDWAKYTQKFEAIMDARDIPDSLDRRFFEEKTCCLLCSEPTPENCHRRLVAERIKKYWHDVKIRHLI